MWKTTIITMALVTGFGSVYAMEPLPPITANAVAPENTTLTTRAKILFTLADNCYWEINGVTRDIKKATSLYQQVVQLPINSIYTFLSYDMLVCINFIHLSRFATSKEDMHTNLKNAIKSYKQLVTTKPPKEFEKDLIDIIKQRTVQLVKGKSEGVEKPHIGSIAAHSIEIGTLTFQQYNMLMLQDKLIDWFDAKNHDLAEGLVHLLGLEKSVLYAETELHNELTALWTNTPKSPNIHYDLSYDLTWRHHSLFNRAIQPIKDALPTYYDRAIDLYLKAKKYDLATLCLEKQANQNNNPLRQCLALADLGKNYYEGVVAPKNYVRAYAYFEKALEKGSPLFNGKQKIEFENTCLMRMAKMCFYGDSTFTRNYVQALAHLNKVQNRTSKYQSRNRNNKIDWEIGDILLLKGQIYLLGDDGVKRDLAQAQEFLLQATKSQQIAIKSEAHLFLGEMYRKGVPDPDGIIQEEPLLAELHWQEVALGTELYPLACTKLGSLYYAQKDFSKAHSYCTKALQHVFSSPEVKTLAEEQLKLIQSAKQSQAPL